MNRWSFGAVLSAGLLGLGSKLYPSNMPRMFNKDVTPFLQSLSPVHHDRASERKALLAGCSFTRSISWVTNTEKCDVMLPWYQNFWITKTVSLSNDNGDGNENGKKAIG